MRQRLDVMADKLNVAFRAAIDAAAWTHLAVRTVTAWDIFSDRLITCRCDGKPMTFKEENFIRGFGEGYAAAMELVRHEAKGE